MCLIAHLSNTLINETTNHIRHPASINTSLTTQIPTLIFTHVERKDNSDWLSAWRGLLVEGTKTKGRGRKTWNEWMKVDMNRLGLVKNDAHNRDKWRSLNTENRFNVYDDDDDLIPQIR